MAPKRIRRSGPIAGLTLALLLLAAAGGPAAAKPYLSADNVPMAAGYRSDIVVGGLAHPWGMAWLPDGTLLVTERPGRLRLVRENGLAPEPVSGLPEIFVSGQAGLLDVAVDPDFEANRWIYLSHAHGQRSENRLRVVRARLENGALKEVVTLCETLQAKSGTQHFGSRPHPAGRRGRPGDGTVSPSVLDRFGQIRQGLGPAAVHVAALAAAGGDVFVNPVVALDEFGESQVFQFAVGFGGADAHQGDQPAQRSAAVRTDGERFVVDRLDRLEDPPTLAGRADMLILVDRHGKRQLRLTLTICYKRCRLDIAKRVFDRDPADHLAIAQIL